MKKIIALIFTMIFSAVLLCGCNEDEKGNSVAYEDLEYGSTMRQILNGNIDLYFDGRFLTDEEMNAVSDYYYAVETDDLDAGVIVELKYAQTMTAMEKSCAKALAQIRAKRYAEYLHNNGREKVLLYGIAFCKKKFRVMAEKL